MCLTGDQIYFRSVKKLDAERSICCSGSATECLPVRHIPNDQAVIILATKGRDISFILRKGNVLNRFFM